MATGKFTFRMSSEGANQVIDDLRKLAAGSADAQRALTTLTQASPQLASVQDGVAIKMRATADAMRQTTQAAQGLGQFLGRGGAIGVGIAAATAGFSTLNAILGAIPRAGDVATAALGRLSSAIGSDFRARQIFQELAGVSRQTGVAVTDSAATFQRFAIAARDIGTTNAQIVQLVEGIQKFGIVAGASMQETSAATQQLGQALASGKLQGDELRSILENMPQLAQALAKELGTTIGALRQMGEEGKLTSDVVMPALLRASQSIGTEFEKLPLTMARAQSQFDVAAQSFLSHVDQAIGLSSKLAAIIASVASGIDSIRRGLGGTTQAEEQLSLQRELADVTSQLNAGGTRAPGILAPFRAGGAIDRERNQALLARQQEIRDRLRQINNDIVRAEEADFEAAQESRLAAQRTTSTEQIKKIQEELDKSIKLRREYAETVKSIDRALNVGAIDGAEADKLKAAAQKELGEALEKLEPKGKAAASGIDASARAAAEAQKAFASAAKDAASIEAELDPLSAASQRLEEALRRVNEAVSGGFISSGRGEELKQSAYARMAEDVSKLNKNVDETDKDINRFFQNMASKTEDAIIRWQGLGNVVRAVGEDIARLLLRRFVTNPLADAGMNLFGGAFNWLGGLFRGGAGGNLGFSGPSSAGFNVLASGGIMTEFGRAPLRRYAGGGVARTPQLAMFGEGSMPEAYVPLPDGNRIPVAMKGSAGGQVIHYRGGDVHVHVANTNASPSMIAATARAAAQQENRRFVDEINRGGPAAMVVGRRRSR